MNHLARTSVLVLIVFLSRAQTAEKTVIELDAATREKCVQVLRDGMRG